MEQNPFKKILFLITSAGEAKETIRKVHGLARVCHAKLIILNVIDKMQIQRMKRFTNQSTTEIEVEMEENGWKYLYFIEELSKNQGIPTVILQNIGVVETEVLKEATRLKADLIIAAKQQKKTGHIRRLDQGYLYKIVENTSIPVLIIK
ncbi:MAG: universal stress protein [Candidatus Marinimicrobia bacterium]|nr:universal stress protein [Candidatus Neomarinimicrobiota bacterium]RKY62251.1 MAG: hypothetical protein DRP96_00695 [Candidatus Neomarinimicrobiota bacterium]